MTTNSKIQKKDLRKVFWRSCTLDSAWNYERQQNLMYCYAMIPFLRRLYREHSEEMAKGLTRHLEFMSCTPHIVTTLMGITGAMEEENCDSLNFSEQSIDAVKTSLMGPLAGIGDAFFWGTLLTIAIGISVSFSQLGSVIGPVLFLLIINIPGFLARYFGLTFGYRFGTKFFGDAVNQRKITGITKAASALGLMVIGGMVATMINIQIPYEIGVNGATQTVQSYIDQIMPAMLPLMIFLFFYWILGKKIKPTTILLFVIALSIFGAWIGIL